MSSTAFLSVRLPPAIRDRLKVAAASRGDTVQGLVGTLVERFLAEEARAAPSLAVVLGKLRALKNALAEIGESGNLGRRHRRAPARPRPPPGPDRAGSRAGAG